MLITGLAMLMMAAGTPPAGRADCIAMPIPLAWHDGTAGRRDPRARDIRIDQGARPRSRCFRLTAR